ncbi:acyloxyacyl hydrolase [Vibrio sp. SM6]|uniref:Acyloxyacyl hydrolase n=1 Tax=Vibrio agarilyticus TaxID=2726741 RepID=A0A7X8YFI2_9VIBR|nr:acyloxyacyl hydrolase [Vibrio agarilyticus]NLS11530.1 acyloxyacyl hydrolase [Vibrio agarilyticus]
MAKNRIMLARFPLLLITVSATFSDAFALPTSERSVSRNEVSFGAGAFGVFDSKQSTIFKLGYAYRDPERLGGFSPILQGMIGEDSLYYLALGAEYQYQINSNWSVGVSVSGGYLHSGSSSLGHHLGHDLQFYSTLSATYYMTEESALRLEYGHISNSGFGDRNPGSESLIASYIFRF